MNILIVEEDAKNAAFLSEASASLTHNVVATVGNTDDLDHVVQDYAIDLAVISTGIEGRMDGTAAAKMLREAFDIPTLFIASGKDPETIKKAMAAAPLGYLFKPLAEEAVEAALMVAETQIKRLSGALQKKSYTLGPYPYITATKTLTKNGRGLFLTKKEARCLEYMFEQINQSISSERLIIRVWGPGGMDVSSLRELICRLRKKLPELPIKNVPSYGYVLFDGDFPDKKKEIEKRKMMKRRQSQKEN